MQERKTQNYSTPCIRRNTRHHVINQFSQRSGRIWMSEAVQKQSVMSHLQSNVSSMVDVSFANLSIQSAIDIPVRTTLVDKDSAILELLQWLYLYIWRNSRNLGRQKITQPLSVPATKKVKCYGGRSPKFIWAPCHVMCTAVLIG